MGGGRGRGERFRWMVVIAHPDDECMFFGPTLLRLAEDDRLEVFVLCLSDGGFRGKGKVRSKELVRSCRALGVAQDHVLLADHADLRDGPGRWNKETVAEVVGEHVTRLGVSRLVTFDEHGVSGHVNHRDVHRGVAYYAMRNRGKVKVWELESLGLVRKYTGFLECATAVLLWPHNAQLKVTPEFFGAHKAMLHHRSQLAWAGWFRFLYMLFSSYMYCNMLNPMRT